MAAMIGLGCQPRHQEEQESAAPDVASERKVAARQLVSQSITMLGQKDYQGALKSLDAAIQFDPTNQEPYFILGQILLKSEEYERAAAFMDNAAKNFPDNPMFFYMLGIAHFQNGKKLPAVLALRRSFELFKKAGDEENAQKSGVLLQQIINTPEDQMPGMNNQKVAS